MVPTGGLGIFFLFRLEHETLFMSLQRFRIKQLSQSSYNFF